MSELTLTRPPRPARASALVVYSLAACVFVAAIVLLVPHLRDTPRASLTVVNPTVWDVGVDVITDDDSRTMLATVSAETTREIDEIAKSGATWVLSWRFRGAEILRTSMSDAELRASGYRVEVPAEVTRFLHAEGAPAAP